MILQVVNGAAIAIDGVALRARLSVKGDTATVAIATADVIATPRIGQTFDAVQSTWEFVGKINRTRDVLTVACRRLSNG